jgi:ATP-dependent Clp protease adaptor protein ClpS
MNPYSTIVVGQEASPTPPAPAQPEAPAKAEEPKGPATAVATAPSRAKTPPVSKPLDMYKVLLHNAEEPTIIFVVQTIVGIVPMAPQQALTVTMEAHETGVALVTVTHLELAELYQDQFQSKGLTVTLEKA